MKNKQILVISLIVSMMFLLLLQNVSAAANSPKIKDGKYIFETRFENKKVYASCSVGGQLDSHVNLVVYKSGTKISNWHIGKDSNEACMVATDTLTKKCVRMCYDGTQKCGAKVGDILKVIGLSNGNIKAIQNSREVMNDFSSIGMCKGSSPHIMKAPNPNGGGWVFIAGITVAAIIVIASLLGIPAWVLIPFA